MKKLLLFGCLALFLCFTGCSKDDDDNTPATTPPTKTQLITAKPWKLTAAKIANGGQDIYSTLLQPCQQDNIYRFAQDGKFIVEEGASACTPPNAGEGTWAFKTNETIITITAPASSNQLSGDFTVKELTATTAALIGTEPNFGISYEATFTAQ